ncbi:hypothetical protein V6N11_081825 [Hibiscus sabdariffa]|uniref:Uncharacterized protein n=1 Tax=Hibiscus sabdariffa TaxID=183260 RepID=A0ABR2Q7A9_9ROSI
MDKMEVEANPPGVGDALALVDFVNGESILKPSFRDIVGGGIVADQRNNIIDSLDVSLTEEDVRVTNRKRQLDIARQGMNNEGPSVVLKGGSQFKALDLLGEDNQRNASGMEQDSGREPNTQGIGGYSAGCDGSGDGHVEQPCWEEVVVSPRVAAKGPIRSNYAKGVKRSSVASKALPQKDVRSKNKNELGSAQLVVADWASKFASSLNMGTMAASSSVVNDVNNVVVGDVNYEPRDENVSIEAEL